MIDRIATWVRRLFCHHPLLITVEGRVVRKKGHMVIYRVCPDCGREFKQVVV